MNEELLAKCREFGEKRIEITKQAKTSEDWEKMWYPPTNPFPLEYGPCWTMNVEYKVADFEAEVGFFLDVFGLESYVLDENDAMFTGLKTEFYFSVVRHDKSTPGDLISLEFMCEDISKTHKELVGRGVEFETPPKPYQESGNLYIADFRTPNGIRVRLWGMVDG
jgi:predicted enzyme related to lactoylglutathione lyase